MKAKEYFEKYEEKILCGETQPIYELFMEMAQEAKDIMKARGCKTDAAAVGVVKEMNDRWNAIVGMFEKKYHGLSPIRRNGYKNFWLNEIPEMKRYFNPQKS